MVLYNISLSDEEKNVQKRLSYISVACLVGSVVFPPLALAGGAIIAGQIGRAYRTKNSGDKEEPRTDIFSYDNSRNSFTPESPETAVARTDSSEASRLLKQLSKDSVSKCALDSASKIVHDYLSEVPQERLENSNGVKVSFERRRRNLTKILLGRDAGFKVDIELK